MKKILLLAVALIGLSVAAMAQKAAPTVSAETGEVQNIPEGYGLMGKYQDMKTKTYYLIFRPSKDGNATPDYSDYRIFYGLAGDAFAETRNGSGSCSLYEIVFNTALGMVKIARHQISGSTVTVGGKEIPIERFQ